MKKKKAEEQALVTAQAELAARPCSPEELKSVKILVQMIVEVVPAIKSKAEQYASLIVKVASLIVSRALLIVSYAHCLLCT